MNSRIGPATLYNTIKKHILLLAFFLLSTSLVLAQETELPDPGLTPDSPFYFLERISEGIRTFFTFGDLKKAERHAVLAAERMAEAEAVVEKGKPEFAEKTLERYEMQLNKSITRAEKAEAKGKSTKKVMELVAEGTSKHLRVIEKILEKVSEKTKTAAVKAKETSMAGQENALKALAKENPERATEINLKAAEARLNRAKVKTEEGDIEEAEKAIKEFENQYKFGEEISQIAKGLDKDTTTVEQLVARATTHHLEVLNDVYNKVPEQAKETIQKAMVVSEIGRQSTVEVLREKGALENIPETVFVPWEIRERVVEERKEEVAKCVNENEFCGGIAGIQCCSALTCKLDGNYPDAGGKCIKTESCKDLCGDGVCQEIVCQAVGCPCSETSISCPQDCARECSEEYEYFSTVYDKYPNQCCDGLIEWHSGMDSRISVADKCYETGLLKGSPVGTCINCGDGFCRNIEHPCNCPVDCVGKDKSAYTTVEEFCEKGYSQYCSATLSSVQVSELSLCQLCQITCRDEDDQCYVGDLACCSGLKEVPMSFEDENGECIAATCGSICRPCGNGVCDENENRCNCPDDCQSKKDILKIDIIQAGSETELTVLAENCPNEVDAFGFDVKFEGQAKYLEHSRGDLTKDFEFFDTNDLGNNTIRVGGFTTKGIIPKSASGNMVILKLEGQVSSAQIINPVDDVADWVE